MDMMITINREKDFMRLFKSLVISSLVLSGCISAPVSVIDENRFSELKGKCFKLVRNSVLYKMPQCINQLDNCYGIQAFGTWNRGPSHLKRIPNSESELEKNRGHWNSQLNAGWGRGGTVEFSDVIKEGEKLFVSDILLSDFGTVGNVFVVHMSSPSFNGKAIELATPYHLIQPEWVDYLNDKKLVFDEQYLKECRLGS